MKRGTKDFPKNAKERKGEHVAVVISFIIFVVFVIFLIFMLQPSLRSRDRSRILDGLRIDLFNNYTMVKEYISVVNSSQYTASRDCIKIMGFIGDGPLKLNRGYVENSTLYIWEANLEIYLNYSLLSGGGEQGIALQVGDWPGPNGAYLKQNGFDLILYIGEENEYASGSHSGGCNPEQEGTSYDVSLLYHVEEWEWLPEEQIAYRVESYNLDYEFLKDLLHIPEEMDFAFNFTYSNGTTIGTEWDVPPGVSLYIEQYPVVYQDINENLHTGILIIGIW